MKDNDLPLLSVCMITYNHEKFIKKAIEGVLRQKTNFKIELVISNDNSTDQTHQEIISATRDIPSHIKLAYYNQEENLGMVPNFTFSLESCKGKYIALCEGDDYWTDPLKLQKQIDFLEKNKDFVVCCHNATVIDENENIIKQKKQPRLNVDRIYSSQELKQGAWLLTLSIVFRNNSEIIKIFSNSESLFNSDMLLFSILGKYGKGYYMEDIQPAMYREHSGGVWSPRKNDKYYILWHRYQLEKVLQRLHYKDKNVFTFFQKRITDMNRELHRNLFLLDQKKRKELNKDYFKWNKIELVRIKFFLKNNLNYLKLKLFS